MEIILAQKGKQTREFTRVAWDRLGKERSGWVALPPEAQNGGPGKKAVIPPAQDPPADTPRTKTVKELQKELAAAIAAEEAAEATGAGADPQGETNGPGNEYTGPFSNDEGMSWQAAVKNIKTLETAEAVNNYVAQEDDRKTVQGAKALRLEELKTN